MEDRPTDRQTDRPKDLGIKASSWSLKNYKTGIFLPPPLSCVRTVMEALAVYRSFLDGVVIFGVFQLSTNKNLSRLIYLIMNYSMFHILLFFHDVPLWTKQGSVKGSRNASIKQHMPQLLILNFLVHLFCWLPIQEDITRWLHNLFPSTTLYKWIIFNSNFSILVLYLIQILNFPYHPTV